jgi:hypothetical protein
MIVNITMILFDDRFLPVSKLSSNRRWVLRIGNLYESGWDAEVLIAVVLSILENPSASDNRAPIPLG